MNCSRLALELCVSDIFDDIKEKSMSEWLKNPLIDTKRICDAVQAQAARTSQQQGNKYGFLPHRTWTGLVGKSCYINLTETM